MTDQTWRLLTRAWHRARWIAGLAVWLGGCSTHRGAVEPQRIRNPNPGAMTIAVAPAVNLSGSTDFDPDRVADLMAGELMHVERVSVIPVSRIVAVLLSQGTDRVHSPAHASEIAGMVGADAILVFAVTEYNPYDPPSVALSVQLFAATPRAAYGALAEPNSAPARPNAGRVLVQTQRRLDASHADVVEDVRRFARHRGADENPYGWRKYIVSQQHFIRYCCHTAIRGLLEGQGWSTVAQNDTAG